MLLQNLRKSNHFSKGGATFFYFFLYYVGRIKVYLTVKIIILKKAKSGNFVLKTCFSTLKGKQSSCAYNLFFCALVSMYIREISNFNF